MNRFPSVVVSPASVLIPFELVAHYDRMRLAIYKSMGARGGAIALEECGTSSLLRFDDVGYFNAVYSRGDDLHEQFDRIEEFFRGSTFTHRLMSPLLQDDGALAEQCRRRGWTPGHSYAWLSGASAPVAGENRRIAVRSVCRHEVDAFFRIYLAAFEADPARVPAAIDNMRHLFDEPSLHFQFALGGGEPVGVGILMHVGDTALLCAGAMLPGHRGLGGHESLIAARRHLAHTLGCASVHSWAVAGSRSHLAMERMGLQTIATSLTWHRPPAR